VHGPRLGWALLVERESSAGRERDGGLSVEEREMGRESNCEDVKVRN
jgi:hypothetical protein